MSDQEERDRTVREPDAESSATEEAEVEGHRWTRGANDEAGPSEEADRWTRGGPEDDA